MYRLKINCDKPYEIIVQNNLIVYGSTEIKKIFNGNKLFVITDKNLEKYQLAKLKTALTDYTLEILAIPGGEQMKSLEVYKMLCEKLLDLQITRGDMLVAFGGGVIGDLTGFIAATLFRGIPFIQIPTSLLAMVDSSIGGKTGIDFHEYKNILGAFWQPKLVLIDPLFLETLPERQLKNGYGEMIKHALIYSPKLFKMLENNTVDEQIIYENLLIKKHFVEIDEYDQGERMKLNFGHTFGHIIEIANNLLHGEAVLSGILAILDFEIANNLINPCIKEEFLSLCNKLELNYIAINYKNLLPQLYYDKKNFNGMLNLILIDKIGSSFLYKYGVK